MIITERNKIKNIQRIIRDIQKFTNKKIHPLIQTIDDFIKDINDKNKAILEIIRTGIVLYGQEEYIKISNPLMK